MTQRTRAALIALAVLVTVRPNTLPGGQASSPRAGDDFPLWAPGDLDIHQISTGRGNSAFFMFPDGETMLIDAGDTGGVVHADWVSNGSRTAAAWIASYVRHMMGDREARIDYAVITHFHSDHMGESSNTAPRSSRGNYVLSGITEVAEAIPVSTIIDRGWPSYDYLPPAPTDKNFANYRRFLDAQSAHGTLRIEGAKVGRADQITCSRCDAASGFEVRIVAANASVWIGRGDETKTRFPPLDSVTVPEDRPTENMCGLALTMRYGRFGYFTGGDIPGYSMPGRPTWHDVETDIARAIGPMDVHVVNHHGEVGSENPVFLTTLRSRVMIVPAWARLHAAPDVLGRMLSKRLYPEPRDIFIIAFPESMKADAGSILSQVAADHGHIVVRVEPGGARYRVFVLDDRVESYRILSVHGPYESQLPTPSSSDYASPIADRGRGPGRTFPSH